MKKLSVLIGILSIITITACGGGSSSDDDGGDTDTDADVIFNDLTDGATVTSLSTILYTASGTIDQDSTTTSNFFVMLAPSGDSYSQDDCDALSGLYATISFPSEDEALITLDTTPYAGAYLICIDSLPFSSTSANLAKSSEVSEQKSLILDNDESFTGTPDTSYGDGNGYVNWMVSGYPESGGSITFEQDSEGNLIIFDGQSLFKYSIDGAIDSSFDTTGINDDDCECESFALDSNNNIYVVGTCDTESSPTRKIWKFDSNGSSVTSMTHSETGYFNGIYIDSDDSLYVASSLLGGESALLGEYDADLNPVTSFGTDGEAIVSGVSCNVWSVVQASSGNFIVSGEIRPGEGRYPAVFSFTSSGELDASFGNNGYVYDDSADGYLAYYMVLDASDNIYIYSSPTDDPGGLVAKYDSGGSLVTSFGSSGKITMDSNSTASAIKMKGDNLYLFYSIGEEEGGTGKIAALNKTSGTADTSIFTDGVYTPSLFPINSYSDMIVDNYGRILMAGYWAENNSSGGIILMMMR